MRHDIDWFRALTDAELLADSTANTGERNLARAYLSLLRDFGSMSRELEDAMEKLAPTS